MVLFVHLFLLNDVVCEALGNNYFSERGFNIYYRRIISDYIMIHIKLSVHVCIIGAAEPDHKWQCSH